MFRARRILRRRDASGYAAKRGAAAEEQARAEAPEPEPDTDSTDHLRELTELREQGLLTEEEFAAEKKKLLGF